MREDDIDRVCRQGTAAWKRLKSGKNWHDWVTVGEALGCGREWAMHQAGSNKPEGKGYNMAFGEWLLKYKLNDMDKGDRARLFSVMDNLPMIEQWRATLPTSERLKLNHPSAVLRKWKTAVEPEKEKSGKPTLRDAVADLSEEGYAKDKEIEQLKAHIEELEAAAWSTGGETSRTAKPKSRPLAIGPVDRCTMSVRATILEIMRETDAQNWDELFTALHDELADLEKVAAKRKGTGQHGF